MTGWVGRCQGEQAGTAHGQVKRLKIGETKAVSLQKTETVKAGGGLVKRAVKWEE